MGKILIPGSSGGGVGSDDVTAGKAQVLQGYRTITSDSDDEVVEGTFPITNDTDSRQEFWYYNEHGKDAYVTRIPEAAYRRYYNHDGSQGWDPWVRISRQLIKNSINYHPELTIDTVTTCGERGQIPDRGDGQVVSYLQGREDWANRIWVLFKNGWYHRTPWDDGQGHIHEAYVYVTYEQIKNLFGIDASKMLQGYSVAGVQGAIPWWVCTTGDVITALGGEGFAWDDTTGANRGRGIATRIPNGHFIQGANYAFLPSPNLYPWNIREGVNIHGIVGTMKDSNAGRVAFRNATFDNVLVSGVANTGLGNNLNVYSKPSTELRDGIIRFSNTTSVAGGGLHQYRSNSVLEEAVTLAHSVNLSPFRTIRLGLKYPYGGKWGTTGGVGSLVGVLWALPTNITPDYVPSRNSKINPNVIKRVGYKDGVIPMAQGRWNTPTEIPVGAEYFVDIDVSDLQGHHRIVLGMAVSEAGHRENITIQVSVYVNNSVSGISHIEFIN